VNPLEELADRQWRDYRARQPGMCFADPGFVLSLAEAYEVQDTIAKLRIAAGDRLIGYKVGCTGPGTVQQFGMQGPIRGCLFESEIRRHGDTLNFDDFAGLAIEGEMAVRIASDGTIAAAFPVTELHHFVFRGLQKRSRNSSPTMASMAALSCHMTVGSHHGSASRGKTRYLFGSTVALSPPIDDRNTRPLTIAFATIVMVWMLAFGIVSVSAQFGARSHHMADSAGSIASSIEK
jgi:hypothetical protein